MKIFKKIATIALLITVVNVHAQDVEPPVKKGDYKLLKLDILNLMGLGVQKLHVAYETSPMKANANNLPTISLNATIPFNSLNVIDINYGIEAGAELRFYQRKRNANTLLAEGLYLGIGIDGGYTNFNRVVEYRANNFSGGQEVDTEFSRIRTGIYAQLGGQAKLGDKLYFDASFGLGWSNVNVGAATNTTQPGFSQQSEISEVFYLLYREGKGQRLYTPVSVSIGYNFGAR
ncbi:hypothetical protein N9772_06170 [Bacteroidia bacterium]|jgi:hypothetical protein|nr:hypothetical protein [Bacteroidia bacterium]